MYHLPRAVSTSRQFLTMISVQSLMSFISGHLAVVQSRCRTEDVPRRDVLDASLEERVRLEQALRKLAGVGPHLRPRRRQLCRSCCASR